MSQGRDEIESTTTSAPRSDEEVASQVLQTTVTRLSAIGEEQQPHLFSRPGSTCAYRAGDTWREGVFAAPSRQMQEQGRYWVMPKGKNSPTDGVALRAENIMVPFSPPPSAPCCTIL